VERIVVPADVRRHARELVGHGFDEREAKSFALGRRHVHDARLEIGPDVVLMADEPHPVRQPQRQHQGLQLLLGRPPPTIIHLSLGRSADMNATVRSRMSMRLRWPSRAIYTSS
jgi:hypothetical protein